MKRIVRLTESDLHRLVETSVKRALNEIGDTQRGQYMLGRVAGRALANHDSKTYFAAKKYCQNPTSLYYKDDEVFDQGYTDQFNHDIVNQNSDDYRNNYLDTYRKYNDKRFMDNNYRKYKAIDDKKS